MTKRTNETTCTHCGGEMWIDAFGVSYHCDTDTTEGLDIDRDHVAVADTTQYS